MKLFARAVLVYILFAFLISFVAIGCSDAYRYPCHNPDNWNKPECNKPDCLASGDCTEMIMGIDKLEEMNATKLR